MVEDDTTQNEQDLTDNLDPHDEDVENASEASEVQDDVEPAEGDSDQPGVPDLHIVEADENGVEVGVEQIVEAILFSSDGSLAASRIAATIGNITAKQIRDAVENLNRQYLEQNRCFTIHEIAGGFQMLTRPQFSEYLQRLYKVRSESRLSVSYTHLTLPTN